MWRVRSPLRQAPLALAIALAVGCASAPPVEEVPSAEKYYEEALQVLEGRRVFGLIPDVDDSRAIELFQEVIDNYPYSEYATLSELKIADVYYEREDFEQAASYYQDFVELHPGNAQVDYAIYRNGMCAFSRLLDPDRDQTETREAIAQFDVLLKRYPDSKYSDDARAMISQAQERLIDHEVAVGDFYFDEGRYHAAQRRYERVLAEYPDHSGRTRIMLRLARALRADGSLAEAEAQLVQLLAASPPDDERKRAEKELSALGSDHANGDRPAEALE